jgi:hypothetical protein
MCKTALCKLASPAECKYRVDGDMSFAILCGGNQLFDGFAKCPYRALAEIRELAATTANNERDAIAAFESWAQLFEVHHPDRGPITFGEREMFLSGYRAATAPVS